MKKFVKLLIISIMILASVLSFAACGGNSDKDSETGIVCKKDAENGFYTVIDYNAEENVTSLDISVAAKAKYGDEIVVGRIRKGAFDGNTTLEEIIVTDETANGTLTIDEGAFKNMRELKKITLPFVGANRFSEADYNDYGIDLDDLNEQEKEFYKKNKTTDKERSFGYIFGEEENAASSKITFTYGDKSDMTADFYIPVALTEITIEADKEINIPMYAFCGLTRELTITLSDNIKAIGRAAFKNMDKLTKVTMPDGANGVKSIKDDAFSSCVKLKDITLPNSLTSIGEGAFADCNKLKYNEEDGRNCLYLGNADNKYLILVKAKSTDINDCTVNADTKFIYGHAFTDCENLINVTFDGTQENWGKISKSFYWDYMSKVAHIVCTDGTIDL